MLSVLPVENRVCSFVLPVENRVCSFMSGPDRELMDVQLSSEESTSDVDGELDTSSVSVKSSISSVSTVDFTSDSDNEEDSIVVHKRETIDLTLLAEKQALKPQEVVSPESKEIESSENIAPPSHQSLVQYIKTNYLNKILFELDRAFFILDKVYKVCFERRFSGVAFAGIMIAVIGILYFANPVIMVPTSLALTVFYCYVVFHKRIYKKLIYNLLVADQQKIPGDKKLYNKRVKVMYMILIAATVLCSTLLPAIPFVLTISSITTLMKLVGNSDYFGFYDREKEAILDKDSEDNSKLIKKILFISFISIAGLVTASVFLTSISLFGGL